MFFLATFVVGILVAGLSGFTAAVVGDLSSGSVLMGAAVVMIGTLGLIFWFFRDAGKIETKRHPFQKKHTTKPRPDGDMSDVVGIPYRDPWLG